MHTNHTIKVFIVDDHYMVTEGIKALMQHYADIALIGAASGATGCLAFLQQQLPDVILMDINMPQVNGIDLCKTIRSQYPSVFVIGLSTFNQYSYIEKMMDNGASGYLLKNASANELSTAIKTVAAGKTYMSPDVAAMLRLTAVPGHPILTRREKQILQLIAEGSTNAEIADQLYISTSTVDTHRKNLLMKLNARNTASLVKIAVDHNLL